MENDFKIKIIILGGGGGGSKHCKATFIHRQNSIPDIQEYLLFANILNITKVTYVLKLHFWRNFVHKICSHKTTI